MTFTPEPEEMNEHGVPLGDFADQKERTNGKDNEASSSAEAWPQPQPLGGELPAVEEFDLGLLPEALRPLVEDVSELLQVPYDYPAAVSVGCLAGVTNRRAIIQPKALYSKWIRPGNLWITIVGPPAAAKTPVISTITAPLGMIESEWRKEHDDAMLPYRHQQEEAELELDVWRKQFKRAKEKGLPLPPRPKSLLVEPICPRLVVHEASRQKLHEILGQNPAGLFLILDELSRFLATLDQAGHEGDRSFYLSLWNGDTAHTSDTFAHGSLHADACCLSLVGAATPGQLRRYLLDDALTGQNADGLLQRFLIFWPDPPRGFKNVDRPPDPKGFAETEQIFRRIVTMGAGEPERFRFAPDAQELFNDWLTELQTRTRSGELHEALQAHLGKYPSVMPTLALLFELADGGSGEVSLAHAQQAADFCCYLESHAKRAYATIMSPARLAAKELGQRMRKGWQRQAGYFSLRDVYTNDWRGLGGPKQARAAVELLDDAEWVRRIEIARNTGRPTERWAINPRIYEEAQ